jgi:hypothetical protein
LSTSQHGGNSQQPLARWVSLGLLTFSKSIFSRWRMEGVESTFTSPILHPEIYLGKSRKPKTDPTCVITTHNTFVFTVNAIFPLAVEPASTPRRLVHNKTWRVSLPIDILLSALSVLVVAQPSSEIPEGLMNNPVFMCSNYIL